MWFKKHFDIFADITTHCNAGCPQCHRTNPNGLKKADWLPLISWSLEDFKKAYRPSTLKLTRNFQICGTWGDPLMNKDIFEICKYIIEVTKNDVWCDKTKIIINTNGSIRNEEWWWDLGVLCGERLHVIFAVDGKNQEQHEKYRKFTNLDKILENMKSLSMTKANVMAQTLVFKHNQNDLLEIKELCLANGAKDHTYVWTDRPTMSFTNPDGTKDVIAVSDREPEQINSLNLEKHKSKNNEGCISCKWLQMRKILVNPDGQVFPCCYLSNNMFSSNPLKPHHDTMKNYVENKDENNIFNKPLEKILEESDWFNNKLPESWESDNPINQCVKYCSDKGEMFNKLQRLLEKK